MTLTDAQIRSLRRDIGDTTYPPLLCDEELQDAYSRADDDEDCARVYALAQMLSSPQLSEAQEQRVSMLLDRWQKLSGCSGGKLRTMVINLGLDEEEPS
ncbi:MAG: hypothetical protein K8I30_09540 [Anaerolineae bacterium]|nr:hypothetical protein [Anaerolineae bacterium]